MNDFDDKSALSFDCYGTLIDWEAGICAALERWTKKRRASQKAPDLLELFGRLETKVETEHPSMVYPLVLAETLKAIGEETGILVSDEDAAEFGASIGRWPAFSDSSEALRRLKERYRLIILSNVDRGSFALSSLRLGVEFDLVLTAQDIGSYKPSLRNFEALFEALPTVDVGREQLLHVAQSLYHDHGPALELGLPSVFIDRRGNQAGDGATPAAEGVAKRIRHTFPSMAAFADAAL